MKGIFFFFLGFSFLAFNMQKISFQALNFDEAGLVDVSNQIIKSEEDFVIIFEDNNKSDFICNIAAGDMVQFEDHCFLQEKYVSEVNSRDTGKFNKLRSIVISKCLVEFFLFRSNLKNRIIKIKSVKNNKIKTIIF
ncbi:MAG: hypothetical protein UR12_C0035G0005 [candidate division TM6 bacterium GW2011_GWF2_30_66]|jgi:hypothetical protein|nr:MAG: hypothetical protein UR12_C0035G0005 [candidate division TM6 bacterium GW2011_GWF2_30_66]